MAAGTAAINFQDTEQIHNQQYRSVGGVGLKLIRITLTNVSKLEGEGEDLHCAGPSCGQH